MQKVRTRGQMALWPLVIEASSIQGPPPVAHAIVDELLALRALPSQRPVDPTSALRYSCNVQLPNYCLQIPEPYAALVNAAFKAEVPNDTADGFLTIIQRLDERELGELSPRCCAPFSLGARNRFTMSLQADGKLYSARIDIVLLHLGETVIKDDSFVVIAPNLSILFSPNPYYHCEDNTTNVWDSLLDGFSLHVEGRCKQKHSIVANAFPGDEGRVPNNYIITATILAINNAGHRARELSRGWYANDSGRPTYRYAPTRGKQILVYQTVLEDVSDELTRTEVLWNYVERLEPDSSDVALAVLAQVCEPSVGDRPKHPMLVPVTITDDMILEYRNIQRNRQLERLNLRRHMEGLGALSFDVEFSNTDPSGRRASGLSWQGDRLFDIVRIEQFQEGLFGEGKTVSTMWAVRAGLWAFHWFSSETRLYIGRMARVLLALDSHGKRGMANKIGQRLLLLSQVCTPRGEVTMFIETLLAHAGELLAPEARSKDWAPRTRLILEEALALLKNRGVLRTVQWPDGFGPDDIDREKGWVDAWLKARIRVRTSVSARTRSDASRQPRIQPKVSMRSNASEITGADIRFARNNIEPRWSQEELARQIGVTRSYLSQIETDKRKPSASVSGKLRRWIDSRWKANEAAECLLKGAQGAVDPFGAQRHEKGRNVLFSTGE